MCNCILHLVKLLLCIRVYSDIDLPEVAEKTVDMYVMYEDRTALPVLRESAASLTENPT